jgi:hypothetical protein
MVSSTVRSATTLWPCQPVFVHNNREKQKEWRAIRWQHDIWKRQLTQSPDAVRCDRKKTFAPNKKEEKSVTVACQ